MSIKYTGLRKGEKMYEELLSDKENTLETIHPKIRSANRTKSNEIIRAKINNLLLVKKNADTLILAKALKDLIPEFNHKN